MPKENAPARTHPDHVHFLAILHEVPNLGLHLLPHPSKVPQHTQLLEGLINLKDPPKIISFNGSYTPLMGILYVKR